MKTIKCFMTVMVFLILSTLFLALLKSSTVHEENEFMFGVSSGQDTAEETRLLIDKVKGYTNFFIINNWNIVTNQTALNQVADYAASADLKFIVYFSYISDVVYSWHPSWLDYAALRWPDHFFLFSYCPLCSRAPANLK